MNRPAVVLTGATSQIGVFAIPRLLRAGFRIVAISRRGQPVDYPQLQHLEWLTTISDKAAIEGCEYLLSAGPMSLALELLQSSDQFHSSVIFSSSSVITKRQSADQAERQQMREMLKLEAELQSLAITLNHRLLILRPSMIYGCGLDTSISRLATWIQQFGFLPVNRKAHGLRQPVHADDLAALSITALLTETHLPGVLELAGGSSLSYSDMATSIFTALNKPARLVRLPQWFFVMLVGMLRIFRPAIGISSEMVRRQSFDLVFDNQQAMELLGFDPRPFKPTKKDFVLPHSDL